METKQKKVVGKRKKKIIMGIIIFGILLIIFNLENIKLSIAAARGDEIAKMQKICKSQCRAGNNTDYCCNDRWIDEEYYTCQSEILETRCELDCEEVCKTYCQNIPDMISCARSGCTWIVIPNGGYCRAKSGT